MPKLLVYSGRRVYSTMYVCTLIALFAYGIHGCHTRRTGRELCEWTEWRPRPSTVMVLQCTLPSRPPTLLSLVTARRLPTTGRGSSLELRPRHNNQTSQYHVLQRQTTEDMRILPKRLSGITNNTACTAIGLGARSDSACHPGP